TVAGEYKPGRVTTSVTDLVVPAAGLPIQITRKYDSLDRNKPGDFGYGWSLSTAVKLDVNASNDVTLTINGQRRTFYFTPQANAIFSYFYLPKYTPEPGFFGSMTTTGDNCFGVLVRVGSLYQCGIGALGVYQPDAYVYTDPYGRRYTIAQNGDLQSLADLNGNTLTVTRNGITSSAGRLTVLFLRDGQGRIAKITDPMGNDYAYGY